MCVLSLFFLGGVYACYFRVATSGMLAGRG